MAAETANNNTISRLQRVGATDRTMLTVNGLDVRVAGVGKPIQMKKYDYTPGAANTVREFELNLGKERLSVVPDIGTEDTSIQFVDTIGARNLGLSFIVADNDVGQTQLASVRMTEEMWDNGAAYQLGSGNAAYGIIQAARTNQTFVLEILRNGQPQASEVWAWPIEAIQAPELIPDDLLLLESHGGLTHTELKKLGLGFADVYHTNKRGQRLDQLYQHMGWNPKQFPIFERGFEMSVDGLSIPLTSQISYDPDERVPYVAMDFGQQGTVWGAQIVKDGHSGLRVKNWRSMEESSSGLTILRGDFYAGVTNVEPRFIRPWKAEPTADLSFLVRRLQSSSDNPGASMHRGLVRFTPQHAAQEIYLEYMVAHLYGEADEAMPRHVGIIAHTYERRNP